MAQMRVAAVQYAAGTDVGENLATTLRMIHQAADGGAEIIVTPEFANHPSWYDDHDHAVSVACELGDDFLSAVAMAACDRGVWVMVNVTLHRGEGRITGSNILFDSEGQQVLVSEKQVLMGAERDHLSLGELETEILETRLGRVGLYSCMDGVINETPRCLALQGGQVLLNSLNSFADDEATLHIPVRAAENRVFVVAANKVGPLIPADALANVATHMGIPPEALHGAGESQIVAPDGSVLAMGPATGEAVVFADIDPDDADDKRRPDGTDVIAVRRPAIYAPLAEAPRGRQRTPGPYDAAVAALPFAHAAAFRHVHALLSTTNDPTLVVLPELAAHADRTAPDVTGSNDLEFIEALSKMIAKEQARSLVVTSIVEVEVEEIEVLVALGGDDGEPPLFDEGADLPTEIATRVVATRHVGVVVGADGVILRQPQLHANATHTWVTDLGDAVRIAQTQEFGAISVVVGDDALQPEAVRLSALADADILAVPLHITEAWELQTGLIERCAENRIPLIAASRPTEHGAALVADLHAEMQLWAIRSDREFDGTINYPRVVKTSAKEAIVDVVHPERAAARVLTKDTDVVDSRPWNLLDPITRVS